MKGLEHGVPFVHAAIDVAQTAGRRFSGIPGDRGSQRPSGQRRIVRHPVLYHGGALAPATHAGVAVAMWGWLATLFQNWPADVGGTDFYVIK